MEFFSLTLYTSLRFTFVTLLLLVGRLHFRQTIITYILFGDELFTGDSKMSKVSREKLICYYVTVWRRLWFVRFAPSPTAD